MAKVNKAKPAGFLFDTGVPVTILSSDFAKALKLKLQNLTKVIGGSGGGKMQLFRTHINKISVGKIASHPQDIDAMSFKNVDVGVPISGVIGLDWMQKHHVIIDLANDVIYAENCQ